MKVFFIYLALLVGSCTSISEVKKNNMNNRKPSEIVQNDEYQINKSFEGSTVLDVLLNTYNGSIEKRNNESYYYNVQLQIVGGDTIALIEGAPFEHYLNFLPPPPSPDSKMIEKNETLVMKYYGPLKYHQDVIVIYARENFDIDYVKRIIGQEISLLEPSLIEKHVCNYSYEPHTIKILLNNM